MILLRFLVLVFNAAIITFLVYEMFRVAKMPMDATKKRLIIIGGILLLLSPLAAFMRFIPFTFQYFIIYPIALSLYIYLIKRV